MVKAIVTLVKPAFYCVNCKVASQILYMDGDKRYCEHCCSQDIRNKAKYYTQNGKEIKLN